MDRIGQEGKRERVGWGGWEEEETHREREREKERGKREE